MRRATASAINSAAALAIAKRRSGRERRSELSAGVSISIALDDQIVTGGAIARSAAINAHAQTLLCSAAPQLQPPAGLRQLLYLLPETVALLAQFCDLLRRGKRILDHGNGGAGDARQNHDRP